MSKTERFFLCGCPKCGRVFMISHTDLIPDTCNAKEIRYSRGGIIGEYAVYCDGVPFIIPVLSFGYDVDGKPKSFSR